MFRGINLIPSEILRFEFHQTLTLMKWHQTLMVFMLISNTCTAEVGTEVVIHYN